MARVTEVRKRSGGEEKTWRVHYEWKLLTGAARSARVDQAKRPPAPGEFVPLLYDRENPKRHALYPMSFWRIAGTA
jgi:hypothetical protein